MYQGFAPQQAAEVHPHRKNVWAQWDKQTNDRRVAFIQLNNLYLAVERGTVSMSITVSNDLSVLVGKVYPAFSGNDGLRNYWLDELCKLPMWQKRYYQDQESIPGVLGHLANNLSPLLE